MRKTVFLHFVPKYLLSFALSLLAVYSSADNISSLLTVDMTTAMILEAAGIAVVMITATTAEILTTAATITATIGAATGKPPREREMNNGTF
mgnify:CR=1 FL=1